MTNVFLGDENIPINIISMNEKINNQHTTTATTHDVIYFLYYNNVRLILCVTCGVKSK